ncbi:MULTISPECIES: substrate-binding periplasmic protein [unclassified Pseudoalteromonas]|uniref:substrate-binding periplasmic protein n=1 Tax=unclassified Pseudoalteromonas TaxID=194690 RepID=UPI003015509E
MWSTKALTAYVILFAASFGLNAKPEVTGAHNLWPPYLIDKQRGFANEVVSLALKQQGHSFRFLATPFSRAMRLALAGKVDIIPALWWSESRAEQFLFSEPYYINRLILVTKNNRFLHLKQISELSGSRTCVIRGYRSEQVLSAVAHLHIEKLTTPKACLSQLYRGRVDAVVIDELVFLYLQNQYGHFAKLQMRDVTIAKWPLHIGVNKSHPHAETILTAFNQGFAKIKSNGEFELVLQKYLLEGLAAPVHP